MNYNTHFFGAFAIVELAGLDKTQKYSIPCSQRDATFSGRGNLT